MQTPEEHFGALIAAYEDANREDRALCEPSVRVKVNQGALAVAALIRARDAEANAELERLRAGIEALAEWWQRIPGDGGYEVACKDHARQALALLNPTEGEN